MIVDPQTSVELESPDGSLEVLQLGLFLFFKLDFFLLAELSAERKQEFAERVLPVSKKLLVAIFVAVAAGGCVGSA